MGLSGSFTVPRDGYVLVRVQAKNAATESAWTVTGNEMLIVTDLSLTSGRSVTKSNVSVTFQSPDGDPVIGSSVSWQTVDGSKRGLNPATTNANGVATFSVINTGPILFTLSGGGLGSLTTKITSASLTDVIAKSGSSITVILPTAPIVIARTITTSMPDGSPVPGVSLAISGGIAGTTSTGVTTNLRSFTTSWNYDGWIGNNTTADADGVLTISGFQVQSVGRDVTANFSDGEISQDAYGSLTTPTTNLMFDQMPIVQIIVDDTKTYNPGDPVTVEVVAIDGVGDPIQGANVDLETVTESQGVNLATVFSTKTKGKSGNISAFSTSCSQQLTGQTSSTGKVTLQICPTTTSTWRADGANIVPSRPVTIQVNPVPDAPTVLVATPGNAQASIRFTAPASNGGAAISNYEYSTDNGVTWKAFSPADTTTPVVITKRSDTSSALVNGTTYAVKLRAVNPAGSGAASTAVSVIPRTTASAPTISAVTASAGRLTVTFTKPSSNGGATITNYEYSTNNGTTWKAFSPTKTSTPLVITRRSDTTGSLVKGTTYKVRIRAINSKGKGTASASKTITAK